MADTKISALPASTTPLAGTEVLPIVQGGATKQVSVANLTAGRAVSASDLLVNRAAALTFSKVSVDGSLGLNGASGEGVLRLYTADTQYGGIASAAWAFGGAASTTDLTIYASNNLIFAAGAAERARLNTTGAFVLAGGTTTANGIGITFPATQSASSNANTLDDYEEGTFTPTITFGGASVGITYDTTYTGATYTKIGNRVCVTGYVLLTNKGSSTGVAAIGNLPFLSQSGTTKYLGASVGGAGFTFANQFWARIEPSSTAIDLYQTTVLGALTAISNSDFSNTSQVYFSATYTF